MDDLEAATNGDVGANGDGLRAEVFNLLVAEAEPFTPSQIAERLDTRRQNVQYHLSALVDAHLVVRDDGEYYVQPLFIDPDFSEAFEEALRSLVPHAESKLYIPDDAAEPPERIILDCLRVAMSMEMFPEADDGPDSDAAPDS